MDGFTMNDQNDDFGVVGGLGSAGAMAFDGDYTEQEQAQMAE